MYMPATVAVTKKTTPAPRVTATRRSVPTKAKVESKKEPAPVKVETKSHLSAVAKPKELEPKKVATVTQKSGLDLEPKSNPQSPVKVNVHANASVSSDIEENLELVPTKVHVEAKKKRQRPRIRPFSEVFTQVHDDINTAYKALQAATRALKSLESAHNREVHNTRSRANTQRTPTIVFDQALVDYFVSRLDPSELTVTRKEQEGEVTVDLSDLSTEKCVHRTDVTQLYNKAFVKHDLRDSKDRRFILYQNDPELVSLLTEGYTDPKPELQEEIKQILDGTYKLNIFNIQRFTSQHLGKVDLPPKEKEDSKSETALDANQ